MLFVLSCKHRFLRPFALCCKSAFSGTNCGSACCLLLWELSVFILFWCLLFANGSLKVKATSWGWHLKMH